MPQVSIETSSVYTSMVEKLNLLYTFRNMHHAVQTEKNV